ncbi:unnamed protein product, partial [Ilex paraguariensis]
YTPHVPVRVHWHVKQNYNDYWRVKIAITNFNYRLNYTQWTLVAQHPNLNNVTQVFSFDYKPLIPYQSVNDTGMFYGMKFYNDLLMEAGPFGNVQSEVLLQKDKDTFTFKQGWAFPRKVYFNGDECMLPPPDAYPFLPNSARENNSIGLEVLKPRDLQDRELGFQNNLTRLSTIDPQCNVADMDTEEQTIPRILKVVDLH